MTRSPEGARWLVVLAALLVVGPVAAFGPAHGAAAEPAAGSPADPGVGAEADLAPRALRAVDSVANATNQSNTLMPPANADLREGFTRADVDVAGATEFSAERLQGRFERGSFERAWPGRSESAQRRLVETELSVVRTRVDRLETRYQSALADYQDGRISASTFLRRVSLVQVKATQLSQQLDRVGEQLSSSTGPPYITAYQTPLDNTRSRLNPLRNPVGDVVNRSLAGTHAPTDVYLLLGPESYVMATSVDGEFSRVAHVTENRIAAGSDRFEETGDPIVAALNRFRTLYSWAFANTIQTPSINRFGNTSIYRVAVGHSLGELTTYADGRTEQVFHEIQMLRQETLPVASTVQNETAALVLTVNATGPTRPMRIELDQAGTGAPLDGVVRVDGTVVGTTGDSGTLWTVQPSGQFTVNVSVDTDSVAVTGP
ncbi:MAG: hypothetical protein V5A43_04555 [Haloarculaceae archaeon]